MTVRRVLWLATTLAAVVFTLTYTARPVDGQQPTSPSPSPTASDPCGGPSRLLATANRPTVGFSTCAVQHGTAVFELGYQNQVNGTPTKGSVQSQVPQNFLRLGIAPRFEFDVIGPNYEGVRTYAPDKSGTVLNGVADSGLGFKYEFPPTGRWTVAFDGLYTGPNGSKFLTAGSATLTGNFDASYAMSSATALGTTIAVSSTGHYSNDLRTQYGVTTPSLVLTTQIPNYYQFYAEYVYVSKIGPSPGGRAFTDFGVQKLLGTRTELDLEYGHAFTGIAELKFNYIGAGMVVQLR
ncbi:MAG: hypothetical protein JOZ77_08580 [Candidatus Eremiobacteraeota bacterium]|nr:hypothetical protein [Candidatus Eremiobacteraeota bacterium]